jgi:laminin alpha 1/2
MGFYGDATRGTASDCKRCACPLVIESNNFGDKCRLDDDGDNGYVCVNCPLGHGGAHCELCIDGYYGNPLEIGSKCEKCVCNDDESCDKITGKCRKCEGNTEGWQCERCKKGFYGDPSVGCDACKCSAFGSVNGVCDLITGKCECHDSYTGMNCDKCEVGFVNVSMACEACDCNRNGSRDQNCDSITGQCSCKHNVHGLKCDDCDELFFGLNFDGCEGESWNCFQFKIDTKKRFPCFIEGEKEKQGEAREIPRKDFLSQRTNKFFNTLIISSLISLYMFLT